MKKLVCVLMAVIALLAGCSAAALAEQLWPVPEKPDLATLPIPPEDLPRILSATLEENQAVVRLDKGLYVNYGCFAPADTGSALVIRADLEDGGWVFAEGQEISAASASEDVWAWDAPEGTVGVEAWLEYESLSIWRYEGNGDGLWLVSFEESGLDALWAVEEGAFVHAAYHDSEGHMLYDFDYVPGTNEIEFVECPIGADGRALFDGDGAVLWMGRDTAQGSWEWTPDEGWLAPDGEAADPDDLEWLGDPSCLTCPVDLNAPPKASGWYSL